MSYTAACSAAAAQGLAVLGGFHGGTEDGLPPDCQSLLLLGPAPDFWPVFRQSAEFRDAMPDPIDRWSARIIPQLAVDLSAVHLLPFGGPPYAPFLSWAIKSGRAWSSPVGMLVHDTAGLMVSFRGALAFRQRLELPPTGMRPCDKCTAKPCLSACPVDALSAAKGYDTAACHSYLDSDAGETCLTQGCIARRACPVSKGANRDPEQSAHHMTYFHKPRAF
ncbi:ferredoxin [Neptunicoccus sediminis]|uniref:ferredoxin n=1 Tax=Neptunicoccus sediminis TaxID=1892596 RepID=UPI00084623F5|nr:ferredoxin [Neptunicoccus sediminis]